MTKNKWLQLNVGDICLNINDQDITIVLAKDISNRCYTKHHVISSPGNTFNLVYWTHANRNYQKLSKKDSKKWRELADMFQLVLAGS